MDNQSLLISDIEEDAEHYTGLLRDIPDHRDYTKRYGGHEIPSTDEPVIDLRKYVGHVYKQGKLSSCTSNVVCAGFSIVVNKEAEKNNQTYYDSDYSRLFLYYVARLDDESTDKNVGVGLRSTLQAIYKYGVCEESLWPYDITKYAVEPPLKCYENALLHRLTKYERLEQDIMQFRACLKAGFPFAFGFERYPSFRIPEKFDKGKMPKPTEEEIDAMIYGLHAVLAVGYDDRTKCITVLNSWGRSFGDDGYFYMPYDYISDPDRALNFWKIEEVAVKD